MKLSSFDYKLPKELIAQYPPQRRDSSRMMVLDRKAKTIHNRRFKDLISYLNKDDVLVFNDSRVVPARLPCRRETGGKAEIFLLKKVRDNVYEGLVRPASKLFAGKRVICEGSKIVAEILENREVGKLIRFANVINVEKELARLGQVPLPPYIKRAPDKNDEVRYQTIYARKDGSTASPTAGLHFTEDMLASARDKGAKLAYLTLHVSYGTFAPVKKVDIEEHRMHKESFELPEETQELIKGVRAGGSGRIITVGTTTTRVLEANAERILNNGNKKKPIKGATGLFISPGYRFKIIDALFTNFHLPKSTLLMLICAFAGREFAMKAYSEAIRERYRFFSYGDCMLII